MIFETWPIQFFVLLGFILLFALIMLSSNRKAWRYPWLRGHYAHRGLYTLDQSIPENSHMAFQNAIDHQFGIELDVQCSKDGLVYVFHDDDCFRMTGIYGLFETKNSLEINALKLKTTQESIPLLRNVIQQIDAQVPLLIEFKTTKQRSFLVDQVLEIMKAYKGDVAYCSFDPLILLELKKQNPKLLRGLNMEASLHHRKLPVLTRLVLHFGLLNFLCRPDYISIDYTFHSLTYQFHRVWGGFGMMWAVLTQADENRLKGHCETFIFEDYLPK